MDPVVILATDSVSAGPGEEARLPVRVRNQGRRVESYRIELVGEPSRFATIEPSTVSVLPGKEAEVSITFRPPAGAKTPTGSLPFGVRAVSEVGSSSSAVAEGRLELAGAAGLQAWADNTAATGRWSAKYHLTFSNQGNAAVRLALTAHDPASTLKFTLSDEVVDVPPGGQVATELRAKTRQPFLRGSPVNRMFTATSQDFPFGATRPVPGQAPPPDDPHARTFQLSFQQKPILSKLAILAALLVVGLIVALVLVSLQGDDELVLGMAQPAAPPSLTATADGSTRILLEWEAVPNATGYSIRRTTEEGQFSGPALDGVDATTLTYPDEGLAPGERRCYAVQATGPEGVDSSPPSPVACANAEAAPELAAPLNFVAREIEPGLFEVAWEYPDLRPGITFTVFDKGDPLKPDITELTTTVEIARREQTFETRLSVRAVDGELSSDPSNAQDVTVPATTVETTTTATTTSVPGPGTTVGQGGPVVPGDPGGTTTSPTTATTASGATTTTALPARGSIDDIEETWVAMLKEVVPPPAGLGEEAERAVLARAFNVPPEDIETFSNRDTVTRDARLVAIATISNAGPEDQFFYVERLDEAQADALCGDNQGCTPMILEGAGRAATGTEVVIVDRLDINARLSEVDARLQQLRTDTGRQAIHAIDTTQRPELGGSQIMLIADGFTSPAEITDFCSLNRPPECTPTRIGG